MWAAALLDVVVQVEAGDLKGAELADEERVDAALEFVAGVVLDGQRAPGTAGQHVDAHHVAQDLFVRVGSPDLGGKAGKLTVGEEPAADQVGVAAAGLRGILGQRVEDVLREGGVRVETQAILDSLDALLPGKVLECGNGAGHSCLRSFLLAG